MQRVKTFLKNNGTLVAFLVLFLFASLRYDTFFTWRNLSNVLRQSSIIGIIAIGMMFVVLCGHIDLSVGSVAAFSGILAAMLQKTPAVVMIFVPILMGICVGFINGFLVNRIKMEPCIASLSTMMGIRVISYIVTNELAIGIDNAPAFFTFIGRGKLFGELPAQVLIFVLLTLVAAYVLRYCEFGRNAYALGGNKDSAIMIGVQVNRVTYGVYMISGMLAALAGVILSSRLSAGQPVAGDGYEMRAIASIVIGGVHLTGGVGTTSGMFLGVLVLNIINNIFNLQGNISTWWQNVITGLILLLVVTGQSSIAAKRSRSRAMASGK